MKSNILLCIGLLLIFACLIAASEIDGKWKGTMQGPTGELDLVYTFKVIDDSLTGSVQAPMGTTEFINGEIDSTSFSFDTEWGGVRINHQCTLEGDSIIMKMPGRNGEETKIILKRQIEKPSKLENVKINQN